MSLPTLRIPLELRAARRPESLRQVQLAGVANAEAQRQGPGAAEGERETVSGVRADNPQSFRCNSGADWHLICRILP